MATQSCRSEHLQIAISFGTEEISTFRLSVCNPKFKLKGEPLRFIAAIESIAFLYFSKSITFNYVAMNYQRLFRDEIPIFDAGTILSNRNFVDTWSCSRVVRGVRANADVDVGGGGFGGGFDVVGVVGDGGGGGQRRRQRQAIRAGPTQSALRPTPVPPSLVRRRFRCPAAPPSPTRPTPAGALRLPKTNATIRPSG